MQEEIETTLARCGLLSGIKLVYETLQLLHDCINLEINVKGDNIQLLNLRYEITYALRHLLEAERITNIMDTSKGIEEND